MTTPDYDAEAREYLYQRDQKLQQRKYESSLAKSTISKAYAHTSSRPEQLANIFEKAFESRSVVSLDETAADPWYGPLPTQFDAEGNVVLRPAPEKLDTTTSAFRYIRKKSEYTRLVEEVHAQSRDNVSLDALLEWAPEDLRLIGQNRLAHDVESWQIGAANRQAYLDSLDLQVQNRAKQRERLRTAVGFLASTFSHGLVSSQAGKEAVKPLDTEELKAQLEKGRKGLLDDQYEAEIARWRRSWMNYNVPGLESYDESQLSEEQLNTLNAKELEVRARLNAGERPDQALNTGLGPANLAEAGLQAVGGIFKGIFTGLGFALDNSFANTAFRLSADAALKIRGLDSKEIMDEQRKQMEKERGDPTFSIQAFQNMNENEAWNRLQEENPEAFQETLRMAGFDPTLAFGIFSQELRDTPEAAQQVASLKESFDSRDQDLIDMMQEKDFRLSSAMLDVIGWYGHQTAAVATGLELILTDQDIWQAAIDSGVAEGWDKLKLEIDRNDARPSAVFGLDGTLVGLGIDLALPAVVDPATWLFGPRLSENGRYAAVRSVEEVEATVNSPITKRLLTDAYEAATNPMNVRRGAGLQAMIGSMPGGFQTRLLKLLGYEGPGPLVEEAWRTLPEASNARYIPIEFIDRIPKGSLPEGYTPELAARGMKGFKHYGEIQISRTTGGVRYVGDVAELETAKVLGVKQAPVALRIVDDFPPAIADDVIPLSELLGDAQPLKTIGEPGKGQALLRVDSVIPYETMFGKVPFEEMKQVWREALLSGWTPDMARETMVQRAWNSMVRSAVKRFGDFGKYVDRYMTRVGTTRSFSAVGPGAVERAHKVAASIWGDDMAKYNYWTERLFAYQLKMAERMDRGLNALKQLELGKAEQIRALDDITGQAWNDVLEPLDQLRAEGKLSGKDIAELEQARRNRAQAMSVKRDLQKEYEVEYAQAAAEARGFVETQELHDIMREMYEDYNRTYLATQKAWKSVVDPETGLVPWDRLEYSGAAGRATRQALEGENRTVFSEDMVAEANLGELTYEDVENIASRVMATRQQQINIVLPVDPLTLVVAREAGGARYLKALQNMAAASFRETAFALNNLWKVDKVFRLSTAVTVSMDELLRIWHIAGPQAALTWFHDRAIYTSARAKALMHGEGISVERGAKYLSQAAQERIQTLQNFPTYVKQAERMFYDGNGLGWDDIYRNDPGYMDAARRWTGGFLQDSGFRAFLRGRDEFREWFMGPDGERMRNAVVVARKKGDKSSLATRLVNGADEAYEGWKTLFEDILLNEARQAGKAAEVRKAFIETAQAIEEGGGVARELPSFVFDHLGPVRGVRKEMSLKGAVTTLTDTFFDKLFMKPLQYRRGFLAELVRTSERARIQRLLASQGKEIVSDLSLAEEMGLKGLAHSHRAGAYEVLEEAALQRGVVTQGMVDRMIEKAVERELDNVLFTWDAGRRAGRQASAIWPFARPYADMMGFWGREILRRPVLRGAVNDRNLFFLRSLNERGLIPFNPKAGALVSRLANTDFTVDRGLVGEKEGGVLPGTESSSFSPLFFLPTEGDNPFASLIPGMGLLPLWALDMWIESADPVKNPDEYKRRLEAVADFIPSIRYQSGGPVSKLLGGGTAAAFTEASINAVSLASSLLRSEGGATPYYNATSTLGDITREVSLSRSMSVMLADPEELALLQQAGSQEEVDMLLMAMARGADARASSLSGLRGVLRWVVPITNKTDPAVGELMDVWVQASKMFPELNVRPTLRDADLTDDTLRRQYANDVRKSFFNMPGWKRDLLIAQYPQLAVNLVSSWEWTPLAETANLPGYDTAYRTGGTPEELTQHQYYLDNGYIRPLMPVERARRILGYMDAAKSRAIKYTYERFIGQVNEELWDTYVPDETKQWLEEEASSDWAKKWGIKDGRELWEKWGTFESELELFYANELGIDPDSEASAKDWEWLKSRIKIPSAYKAWSPRWPGTNVENLTDKVSELKFSPEDLPDDVKESLTGLGIELVPMTGTQFYNALQEKLVEMQTPLAATVDISYQTYVGSRSDPAMQAEAYMRSRLRDNQSLDPEWRKSVEQFMKFADLTREHWKGVIGGTPLSVQQEVVNRYNELKMTSGEGVAFDWEGTWKRKYEQSFGPLEWTAPEPRSPFDAEGRLVRDAMAPAIVNIRDGDSLIVRPDPSSNRLVGVRLLGVRARDFGSDDAGALEDKHRLMDAIQEAVDNGDTIWFVPDPETFGTTTDYYGRMLVWMWIGDKPYYFEEDFRRNQTPSGGGS